MQTYTFPRQADGTYRNAATGVVIRRYIEDGVPVGWDVTGTERRLGRLASYGTTLAEARRHACVIAAQMADTIAEAHAEALAEQAQREMDEAAAHQATPYFRRFADAVREANQTGLRGASSGYRRALDILHAEAEQEDATRFVLSLDELATMRNTLSGDRAELKLYGLRVQAYARAMVLPVHAVWRLIDERRFRAQPIVVREMTEVPPAGSLCADPSCPTAWAEHEPHDGRPFNTPQEEKLSELTSDALMKLLTDFAACVEMDTQRGRLDWSMGTWKAARAIAEAAGVELPEPSGRA